MLNSALSPITRGATVNIDSSKDIRDAARTFWSPSRRREVIPASRAQSIVQ
jgi:hypothetical protein